jgi:hypothetical protein
MSFVVIFLEFFTINFHTFFTLLSKPNWYPVALSASAIRNLTSSICISNVNPREEVTKSYL